jgi:predicted DNA-binding protein
MQNPLSTPVLPGYTGAMKTAISVPDETFRRVDTHANELGMSRSEFFSRAAERYLAELDDASLVSEIDAALARSSAQPHPSGLARLSALTADDEW